MYDITLVTEVPEPAPDNNEPGLMVVPVATLQGTISPADATLSALADELNLVLNRRNLDWAHVTSVTISRQTSL